MTNMTEEELTKEERAAIAALQRLAKKWPETLWLFANGCGINILRTHDGERMMNSMGCVDDAYSVGSVDIPNDGGDY